MQIEEVAIAELQAAMSSGEVTAYQLTEQYIERIAQLDRQGPQLNSIVEVNPDALEIAQSLDRERQERGSRGPLHGIPILLKENIATADRMETTAGSLALLGSRPRRDATVASKLRAAGAVILGKTNLSEWANFRSDSSASGWSARGGQTHNPYVLDRTPCGSSSGSGTAIAASLAAAALGTETDGSILCPSTVAGLVGIKPTVGLTSRSGVVPISHSQDTVGPMARTVADAAALLSAIAGPDQFDAASQAAGAHVVTDYTQYLDMHALKGARIGVARDVYFGYSAKADEAIEEALRALSSLGAIIVDPADIRTAKQMHESQSEMTVLLYEFKTNLNKYLAELEYSPVQDLAEIIAFNEAHAAEELKYFGQELFIRAQQTTDLKDPIYLQALEENHRLSRKEGIDEVMDFYHLDALIMPTGAPAWCIDVIDGDHPLGSSSQPAALAGYPAITVPAGFTFDLPIGLTFMGRAFSEPKLIQLAYAFEQATKHRRAPKFLETISTK